MADVKVYGVSDVVLRRIADDLDLWIEHGHGPVVDIRPKGERFRGGTPRVKAGSQRVVYTVCFHGYADFYDALFEAVPTAKVETLLGTMEGSQDHEEAERKYVEKYGPHDCTCQG